MTTTKSKIVDYLVQHQEMKQYNEYMGCNFKLPQTLYQNIEELPNSPFKFYIECQNDLILKYEEINDYIEMFYPELTPETDILTMIFYIHHKHLTQAISKIDKQQLKNTAVTLLQNSKQLAEKPELSQIGRFFASIILSDYIDYLEESIKIQKDFLEFYSQFLQQINENEMLYDLFLETKLVAFPLKLVQLIYGKNLLKNGFYEQAIEVLKQITEMQVEVAETMYQMNNGNVEQAAFYLKQTIPRDFPLQNKLISSFKFENLDFKEADMQKLDFTQYADENAKSYALETTVLGEFWNNPYLFLLAASSARVALETCKNDFNLKKASARALRDLGSYFLTEFSQKQLGNEDQQRIIYNSAFLFQLSLQLDPTNRFGAESLAKIYLAARQRLDEARQLINLLMIQYGESEQYLLDLARIERLKGNWRAELDATQRAVKVAHRPSPSTILALADALLNSHASSGVVDIAALSDCAVHVCTNLKTLATAASGAAKDKDKKIIFIQNFLYQIHHPLTATLNHAISAAKEKGNTQQLQKLKALNAQIIDSITLFLNTQAGNEVITEYLQIQKRFN